MVLVLLFIFLIMPSLSLGQILPNGFNCEDLIDFANGKASPNRRTSILVRNPNPKDEYGVALLEYDTQLCHRLDRKEITVEEFNVLQSAKVRELTIAKRKAESNRQNVIIQQQSMQRQQAAIQAQREATAIHAQQAEAARRQQQAAIQAQRETALVQAQQAQISRQRQAARQAISGAESNSNQLIQACGAKGFGVDFSTGNCVSPQGRQTNPHNLYQPFTAPLPQPRPNDLTMRCAQMGRVPDFATGRCM